MLEEQGESWDLMKGWGAETHEGRMVLKMATEECLERVAPSADREAHKR